MKAFLGIVLLMIVISVIVGLATPKRSKTADELKDEVKFDRAAAGAMTLRKAMRNPDKFVVESALIIGEGNVVCYQYRGENGFGGMTRSSALLISDKDGQNYKVFTDSNNTFRRLWNKECAGKTGTEQGQLVQSALYYSRK